MRVLQRFRGLPSVCVFFHALGSKVLTVVNRVVLVVNILGKQAVAQSTVLPRRSCSVLF